MATLDEDIGNPNVRKFLDFLSASEGTTQHGYNTQVGGTRFESLAAHPNKTTVETADGKSNAAGRYQFLGSTWAEQAKKLGLTDFSAESQDKAAVGLMKDRGAFQDIASGNFTGAINKLGGTWASLPSSPYKQAKRSWDWAKSQLGADTPQRDYNDSGWQQGGMTPSQDVMKQMQNDAKPFDPIGNLVTGAKSAVFGGDMPTYNMWNARVGDAVEDPNFSMTPDRIAKFTEGVDQKNWDYIAFHATSDAHAAKLQQNALEFQKYNKLYEEAGFGSGIARMATSLLDPTNLGLMALTAVAPELGAPVAATRWGRIGYGALEGAVTNAGLEALTYRSRPGGDGSDIVFAGLMGVGFGGVGGSFARERAPHGLKPGEGGKTIFDTDIKQIKSWSLEQLHDISAGDYAKVVMHGEDLSGLSPEQLKFRQAELIHEYTMLVEKKKLDTLHGTGEHMPPVKEGETPPVGGEVTPPKSDTPPEFKKTWGAEWDTPSLHKGSDGSMVLQLPPKQPIESLIHYIKLHSPDKAMVAWMDKILEGIDLSHVKFFETGASKKPEWYIKGSKLGSGDAAHVVTPWNSRGTLAGDNIQFVQRGKYSKRVGDKSVSTTPEVGDRGALRTGLNDQTFVHELNHVAAVWKQRMLHRNKDGMLSMHGREVKVNPKVTAAVAGIDELHQWMLKNMGKSAAKMHYGMKNAYEFLSEGLTNPTFQKLLRDTPLPDNIKRTNVLSAFLDKVMDMMGIDKRGQTAYHKFLELADDLHEPAVGVKHSENLAPSEGYRPVPDGKADMDTATAAETANVPEVMGVGLGLENRLGKMRLPEAVRGLAQKLFGSSMGFKDHSVVGSNAWDDKTLFANSWNTKLRKGTLMPFVKWSEEQGYKFHQRGEAFEKFGTDVWDYVHGFEREYDPHVVKAGEAVRKNMADRVKDINNPNRSVGGIKRGLTEVEVVAEDGTKKLVGALEENPFYLPRVHDANKWDNMVATHGIDKVDQFWASAYRSGRGADEVSEKEALQFAKWYRKTVESAKNQASTQHLTDMLRGQDRPALLESLKDRLGLTDAEAADMADSIIGKRDTNGQLVANLKHRNTIDERFVGGVGTDIEGMSLRDFVKTNAIEISESYNNRVSGTVSLAKNLDAYTASDINRLIGDAVTRQFGDGYKEVDLAKAAKDLQFAFDRIMSIPLEEGFDPLRKSLSMLRDFNVIRLMSGSVYNQLAETAQMTGTVGYKALLKAIPEFEALSRDLASGKAPSDLLEHLENAMGGAGAEYLTRMDFSERTQWSDHYGKGSWQGKLDSLDGAASRFASGVLDYTGMTPLMVQQKRLHATALVNGFVDLAHGVDRGGAAFLTKERLAHLGISEGDFSKLKSVLKELSSDGEGSITDSVKKVDWDKFVDQHPELHHKFMIAIQRESRRVIQENDLASMIPIMGTTLGKTVFQFMNFSMHAWNKQLMFSLNHKDMATANTMLQGLLFGSMVYSARQYQQSLGLDEESRQKFLENRLNPTKIVANGFSRMGASSMLPNLASTFVPGASELFAGGRTTSDLSGIMSNPTLGLLNGVVTLGKKAVINPLSDEKQFTKSDANAMFKLMPLNNLVGVNTLLNHIASDLPVSSKEGE